MFKLSEEVFDYFCKPKRIPKKATEETFKVTKTAGYIDTTTWEGIPVGTSLTRRTDGRYYIVGTNNQVLPKSTYDDRTRLVYVDGPNIGNKVDLEPEDFQHLERFGSERGMKFKGFQVISRNRSYSEEKKRNSEKKKGKKSLNKSCKNKTKNAGKTQISNTNSKELVVSELSSHSSEFQPNTMSSESNINQPSFTTSPESNNNNINNVCFISSHILKNQEEEKLANQLENQDMAYLDENVNKIISDFTPKNERYSNTGTLSETQILNYQQPNTSFENQVVYPVGVPVQIATPVQIVTPEQIAAPMRFFQRPIKTYKGDNVTVNKKRNHTQISETNIIEGARKRMRNTRYDE